jgi:DNA end-binding protein Ku
MAARAIGSGTVSFGLVSIPVKVFTTSESAQSVSFNMLHAKCGSRLRQQYVCPTDEEVVDRSEITRGYEFAKGQYVKISDDEYKALLEVGKNSIQLVEFVPAEKIDPVYLDKAYYLGPDKGGERAYKLLAEAMVKTGLVGVAKYAARGKQYLVMLRPNSEEGLVMHQLRYADEVRSFSEVSVPDAAPATAAELKLATQIIEQIAVDEFHPEQYEDEVKTRMLELIQQKIEGQEITAAPEEAPHAQVIDLMEALKRSLGEVKKPAARGGSERESAHKPTKSATSKKKSASTSRKRTKAQ